jgi:hypothetical protein
MAVDAQWAYVAAMLPLSADFSDARGNATGFGNNTEILDTVGDPFGAGDAAYFAGYAAGPNFSGGSVLCGYVDLSSDFTIQLAVYPEDGGHGSADAILLQIGAADAPDSLRIIADSTDDPMRLRVARHNGAAYVDLIAVVATDIADDAWHWLQLDRVTNTFTLYVDGAQYSQATLNIYLGGENLYLGHNGSAFAVFLRATCLRFASRKPCAQAMPCRLIHGRARRSPAASWTCSAIQSRALSAASRGRRQCRPSLTRSPASTLRTRRATLSIS